MMVSTDHKLYHKVLSEVDDDNIVLEKVPQTLSTSHWHLKCLVLEQHWLVGMMRIFQSKHNWRRIYDQFKFFTICDGGASSPPAKLGQCSDYSDKYNLDMWYVYYVVGAEQVKLHSCKGRRSQGLLPWPIFASPYQNLIFQSWSNSSVLRVFFALRLLSIMCFGKLHLNSVWIRCKIYETYI